MEAGGQEKGGSSGVRILPSEGLVASPPHQVALYNSVEKVGDAPAQLTRPEPILVGEVQTGLISKLIFIRFGVNFVGC